MYKIKLLIYMTKIWHLWAEKPIVAIKCRYEIWETCRYNTKSPGDLDIQIAISCLVQLRMRPSILCVSKGLKIPLPLYSFRQPSTLPPSSYPPLKHRLPALNCEIWIAWPLPSHVVLMSRDCGHWKWEADQWFGKSPKEIDKLSSGCLKTLFISFP